VDRQDLIMLLAIALDPTLFFTKIFVAAHLRAGEAD
jgi:hypothetical protein